MTPILPYISLVDKQRYNFLSPVPEDIDIETIAHSLSNLCRFTGHTREFYSVAQHSVLVSNIVPSRLALEGLLHDSHEAFVGDIATPLKRLLPDYKMIEALAGEAVAKMFDLPLVMPDEVKWADTVALASEVRDLLPGLYSDWNFPAGITIESASCKAIVPLTPQQARDEFLDRYYEIIL